MKPTNKKRGRSVFLLFLSAAMIFVAAGTGEYWNGPFYAAAEKLGIASASLILPEGAGAYYRAKIEVAGGQPEPTKQAAAKPAVSSNPKTAIPTTTTAAPKTTAAAPLKNRIIPQFYSSKSANLIYQNVFVNNKTGVSIDIKKELGIRPDIQIYNNKKPQVLIIHTHATEGYFPKTAETYDKSWTARSEDNDKNVTLVGAEIKKQLDAAGIMTIQDKTQHDNPSYNDSYDRAEVTIRNYLKKYPSIDVVLDIHRDAITRDNGDKIKPTATIGGKKAAQIMIATGCESGQVTGYPDWRYNLRFALQLQKACEENYKGLARPLYFVSKKYNHWLNHGSLLIEMGSEANTMEEALYSGELVGKALVKVLEPLKEK